MGAEPRTGAPSESFTDSPRCRPGLHLVIGVRRAGHFLGDKMLLSGAAPGSQGSALCRLLETRREAPRVEGWGHRKLFQEGWRFMKGVPSSSAVTGPAGRWDSSH